MSGTSILAQQFTGLPIAALIGGPLTAAAEANSNMALSQIDFMLKSCFISEKGSSDKNSDGSPKSNIGNVTPIMINMKMSRGVVSEEDGKVTVTQVNSVITLPLLTLIPLNSLAVDDVSIDFMMEVKSSSSTDSSKSTSEATDGSGTLGAGIPAIGPVSVNISGSVSHKSTSDSSDKQHYQSSQNATYNVKVHAGQLPLPPGVTSIIQAYSQNISPITITGPADIKPEDAPNDSQDTSNGSQDTK